MRYENTMIGDCEIVGSPFSLRAERIPVSFKLEQTHACADMSAAP